MYLILLPLFCFAQYVSSSIFDSGYNHLKELVFEAAPVRAGAVEKWIQQPLDHFDTSSKTWKMRYFEQLEYAREGGPVYIFIGGEGDAHPQFISFGIIKDLAEETGGALFVSEHRYYGQSRPFENTDSEHMKWLSSEQALADLANLIKYIKSNQFKNSKVVVIGGSYPGNLAAWMKLKYPELVDAAIASSGPVLAKKDFYDYLVKVNENYGRYGTSDCLNKINSMFKRYQQLLQSQEGIEQLKKETHVCPEIDLNDKMNQMTFFIINIAPFMHISQYGGPGKINQHCSSLNSNYHNMLVINEFKEFWNVKDGCMAVSFKNAVNYYMENKNMHSWLYQECTEFGYFATTSSESQPFGHVLSKEYYLALCKAVFGPEFDEARVDRGVKKTNDMYKGLIPDVRRVVFSNGDVDPWSTLSVLKDLSDETPAVVIPKATHCADLFLRSDATEELKQAYKHNKYLIKKWIGFGDDGGSTPDLHKA